MRSSLTGLALAASLGTSAAANDARSYAEAEAAIAAFRAQTFLVTPCERAFAAFWKGFREDGDEGLVYLTDRFGVRAYFGYGNPAAEPLLAEAQEICTEQAGRHGDMVLRVLHDRAREKEQRIHQFEHAERVIGN